MISGIGRRRGRTGAGGYRYSRYAPLALVAPFLLGCSDKGGSPDEAAFCAAVADLQELDTPIGPGADPAQIEAGLTIFADLEVTAPEDLRDDIRRLGDAARAVAGTGEADPQTADRDATVALTEAADELCGIDLVVPDTGETTTPPTSGP